MIRGKREKREEWERREVEDVTVVGFALLFTGLF